MEITLNILCGLGLFFIGIANVSSSLKSLTGSTFRRLMAKAGGNPFAAAATGTLAGALLQSSNAVTFIIIGLINTKAIDVKRGLPILIWANVGTSALVLLASMNLRLVALFLLASTGFALHLSNEKSRYRYFLTGMMGLGLLLMGADLIKVGAKPLQDIDDFRTLITFGVQWPLLSIIIGLILAIFTQSTSTVAVAAIGMTQSGLFGLDQTLLLVYGANIGSGISTALMAANLSGTGRQIAYSQCFFKVIGSLLLILLFFLETTYPWPLVKAGIIHIDSSLGKEIAFAYLFMQLAGVVGTFLVSGPLINICQRLSPPTAHEELSSPKYLYDQALEDPSTAIELAELEVNDILERIPELLPYDDATLDNLSRQTLLDASLTVIKETNAFLSEMLDYQPAIEIVERNLKLQSQCELIVQLMETTHLISSTLDGLTEMNHLKQTGDSVVEGLHFILLTLSECGTEEGADNIPLLLIMTDDRAEIMKRLRDTLTEETTERQAAHYQSLLNVTIYLDRSIWLIRRLVLTFTPN
jgi:phosphate:Na+ symporter